MTNKKKTPIDSLPGFLKYPLRGTLVAAVIIVVAAIAVAVVAGVVWGGWHLAIWLFGVKWALLPWKWISLGIAAVTGYGILYWLGKIT